MVRGLYTAYTGMVNEQKRLDIIANNVANASTIGYKKDSVTNQAFNDMLTLKIRDGSVGYETKPIGQMSLGVKLGEVYTDFGQGSLRETGNTYDLAIEGKGFFELRASDKEGNDVTRYTRDSSFTLTSDGYVIDANGNHLQGENGDVQIPVDAASVAISEEGRIYADGEFIGSVNLVDFDNYDYLEKMGDTYYRLTEGGNVAEATGKIAQGFTEQSNVNSVSEMVQMITITRAYEANQKVITTVDGMLDKSANTVGRVG